MARIQIIDDDPQVRETLKILLEQAGYFVEEAANGNDAVEQYRQQPADLVITDIHMPGKNGIELIQEIQQINPAAKVFVLSGGGDFLPKDKLYMLEVLQSVKAEFEKPLDTEKFLHSVHEILSNGNISSD
jgi:YesN/AraC family two-component response regulator